MKFSIIVPIYNVEKYLKKAIESVIKQNFNDYELILVNDGSKDNSLNICNAYANKYPNIRVVNKENGGLISARRAGVKIAKGDYIISLDGDDYISDNYLNIVNNILKEDIDIVFVTGFDDYEGKLIEYNSKLEGLFNKEDIRKNIFPYLVNGISDYDYFRNGIVYKIVKKELFENNLKYYDESISMGEDLVISTACICDAKTIYISNEKLYFYRQFENQMTKKYKTNLFINEDKLIRQILFMIAEKKIDLKNQFYRHALCMAKSTIYNEVKFKQNNEILNLALKQIYDTQLFQLMKIEMVTKNWTRNEKIFSFLLKHKMNFSIKTLAKINYKLRK